MREMEKRGAKKRKNKKPSQSLPFLCFSSSRPRSHRRVPAQMIENDKKGTEKEEIREVKKKFFVFLLESQGAKNEKS